MDWIQIISIMGGFIGGGGLTALFTLKFSRRKAGADADNAAITALNNAITTMTGIDNGKDDEIAGQRGIICACIRAACCAVPRSGAARPISRSTGRRWTSGLTLPRLRN